MTSDVLENPRPHGTAAPAAGAALPQLLAEVPATGVVGDPAATGAPVLDLVVPVYDEEHDLGPCVRQLVARLAELPFSARVTVVDNASRDATWQVAHSLATGLAGVRALRLRDKGRGRALRAAWSTSPAQVLAYTDVDLSTDLAALFPLVAPLVSGHSDVAIGSRLARGAQIVRGPQREILSRGYNLILRGVLRVGFTDAQCGFKAIRADVARALLPLVRDEEWFFDTELLVLAERNGLRIHEVPVDWRDDPDSRVQIAGTVWQDLRGVARMAATRTRPVPMSPRRESPGPQLVQQLIRFAGIGVLSTLAYLVLYLAMRPLLGAFAANFLALLLTAIGNTAANRRVTFGVRDASGRAGDHVVGLVAFGAGLALTSGALAALASVSAEPSRFAEVSVLVVANATATLLRFGALKYRMGRPALAPPATATGR